MPSRNNEDCAGDNPIGDMMIYSLDHIGVCGEGGELLIQFLMLSTQLDVTSSGSAFVKEYEILCEFYDLSSDFQLEYLIPKGNTKEANALRSWGGSGFVIHHIALVVGDLTKMDIPEEKFIGDMVQGGKPNMRVRFLKPEFTGGVLIELVDYWGND